MDSLAYFIRGLSEYVLIIVFNRILPSSKLPFRMASAPERNNSRSRPGPLASSMVILVFALPPHAAKGITRAKSKTAIRIFATFMLLGVDRDAKKAAVLL